MTIAVAAAPPGGASNDERWGNAFWILAVISAGVALVLAVSGLFGFQWLLGHETYAKVSLLAFLICVIGMLWCVHRWSILRMGELSRGHGANTKPHPCHYCHGGDALVVCSHCDSIQWETLRGWEVADEVRQRRRWARAVFFAHHRWKLLAASLSVVVVGTIAFAAQLEVHLWQQRVEQRTAHQNQAREVINAMTSFRGALLDLTSLCGTKQLLSTPSCTERFRTVIDQYIHLSWHAPPLLIQLQAEHCPSPDGLGLSLQACAVLALEDTVDCMDQSFAALVNAFSATDVKARCDAARRLYLRGRRLGCMMNWLSFGPDPMGVRLFETCESSLQLGAPDPHDLRRTVCADPVPSSANYAWDLWCNAAIASGSAPTTSPTAALSATGQTAP